MYSGFKDCFGRTAGDGDGESPAEVDLAKVLREKGVRQVFCVGLAGDVCVSATAVDAVGEGFESFWIEDGQKCVSEEGERRCRAELEEKGVKVVRSDGVEMERVWG